MLRRTHFLRPPPPPPSSATATAGGSSTTQQKKKKSIFSFITRARLATATAIVSAPLGYYYTQVHLPRAKHIAALLDQKRPERSTPVFTTGGEPIKSLSSFLAANRENTGVINSLVFYFNSIFRLTQFFLRSSYIFVLMIKFGWSRFWNSTTTTKSIENNNSNNGQQDGIITNLVTRNNNTSSTNETATSSTTSLNEQGEDEVNDELLSQIGQELTRVLSDMGGSYVKLGQWCATRSDVFPREVCEALELLYDKAQPHSWQETEQMLKEAGLWDAFESIDHEPVSSGTIAQVHKAVLKLDAVKRDKDAVNVLCPSSTSTKIDNFDDDEILGKESSSLQRGGKDYSEQQQQLIQNQNQQQQQKSVAVAVKVMHPRIRHIILEDMQALRWATQLFNFLIPRGSYLGLTQAVEEFTALLYSQLDMVREAENLNEFRFNFRLSTNTVFPRPFLTLTTPDILVETFEYGIALNSKYVDSLTGVADGTSDDFGKKQAPSSSLLEKTKAQLGSHHNNHHQNYQHNHNNNTNMVPIKPNDFSDLGTLAVEMFLKMVFEDNLVHADLHPGNILVRIVNSDGSYSLKRRGPLSHSQIVVLDPGLVTSMSDRERQNFIALFTCVATGDGDLGAKLMLERAPEQHCDDVPSFTKDMKRVFDRVTPRNLKIQEIDMAGIMREILDTMRHHRVRIDMNFASLVATVALGEGLGRRLVRDFNLFEAAMPFLLHCLQSHELHFMISKLHEMYLVDGMNMK